MSLSSTLEAPRTSRAAEFPPIPATMHIEGNRAIATLSEPTVAASGQAAVIYDGDRVLAGGWLAHHE